jgi:hypothetical protein
MAAPNPPLQPPVTTGESVTTPDFRIIEASEIAAAEAPAWPAKDPDEVLDYGISWAARLGLTDKIIKSEWVLNQGPLMFQEWYVPSLAQVRCWIAGGVVDKTYFFTNRVTSQLGRVMDQTVSITIVKSK